MTVKISKKESELFIFDKKNNLLKSFQLKENYQRALELLQKLNSVETQKKLPVYQEKLFQGKSVWSFFQHSIFYNSLCPYVQYEPAIKFLLEKKIEKVVIEKNLDELAGYLKINGFKVKDGQNKIKKTLISLGSFFIKIIALKVSLLAITKLRLKKTKVLVYTPDRFSQKYGCDFRFFPIYKYLRKKQIHFSETFYSVFGMRFLKNLSQRRRLALYLNAFPVFPAKKSLTSQYNLSIFQPHNQRYFNHLLKEISWRSKNSLKRIKILTRILKKTEVKVLISLDDVRYTNELILACSLNNIKTYGFQHGQFTKYHVGWMNYNIPKELSITFDKLFVWNEYWKRILLSYSVQYNEENVEIGGLLRELELIDYKKKDFKFKKMSDLGILVPYETFAPKKEVGDFVNRFIDLGIKIFFKTRPDLSPEYQFNQYNIKNKEKIEIVKDIKADVLSKIDAVAGTYSTFLNEMVFYDVPLLILRTSLDLGHYLIEEDLGFLMSKDFKPDEILDYIKNYQSKKNYAWPPNKVTLEETLDRICL